MSSAQEMLSNNLRHEVPMSEIRQLEKRQEARRLAAIKAYGNLWSAVYLL
jgi:hypothetical protein